MKTLKVLLQEVVSGIKAWVNSNFAQESNAVHKTGNETVNGVKTFSSANILSEVNRVDKGLWFNGNREVYLFPEWSASYSGLTFASESNIQTFKFGDWKSENNVISFNYDNAYFSIGAGYYSNDNKNKVEITPRNADDSSVGTSTYQWNNVYAKNYYYNGTAWGLDQANTWIGINTFSIGRLKLKSTSQEIGVVPANSVIQYFEFTDKNNEQHGVIGLWDYSDGASEIQMYVADKFKNGQKDSTGTKESTFLSFGFKANGSKFLTFSGQLQNSLLPNASNTYDLGSSSYKWKTLNGINPGALSFPNIVANPNNANPPTGYISIDTTNWDLTNYTINWYTTPTDGWVFIAGGADSIQIDGGVIHYGVTNTKGADGFCESFLPVPAGCKIQIRLKNCTNLSSAYFFPCLGNV